jgi:DNA invertase Pin-like site-specific DNA recombinase
VTDLIKKKAGIYVRVSTADQRTDAQETELKNYAHRRGWSIHRIYADKMSGATSSRPALDHLMADCRKGQIDVVLVWRFDRYARSLRQLVSGLDEFKRLGIDFVSCTEAIDTSLPSGELAYQIFGAIAQFERSLIADRTRAGLAEARRRGQRLGRPPLKELNTADVQRLRKERKQSGTSFKNLARYYGVSVWTAFYLCNRSKIRKG